MIPGTQKRMEDADPRTHVRGMLEELGLTALQAQDLEIGIFNESLDIADSHGIPRAWAGGFSEVYQAKARSIVANLDPAGYIGNPGLLERVRDGGIVPHDIASMPREQLYPELWTEILAREQQRNASSYQKKMVAMSESMTCSRCKQKRVSYVELQTRSGDEGMTVFASCLVCGHRWRA